MMKYPAFIEKKSHAILIIVFLMESLIPCLGENSTSGCIEGERNALLKFKSSISDPYNRLSSWNGEDCCIWEGVRCSKTTGHIIRLDLRYMNAEGATYNISKELTWNASDSSLLRLKHLEYLDLSGNKFQERPIPEFIGSLKQLNYLNLSNINFGGLVPHCLANLSKLRVLDLHGVYMSKLHVDDLMWLSHLSSLEHLDMSRVDLSRAKNIMKAINMLPSLSVLRMQMCELYNSHLQSQDANLTLPNISYLDLSNNFFDGDIADILQNMTSLRVLDLSNNEFNASGPHLFRLKQLIHLNLASNMLTYIEGDLSSFLLNACNLKSLDLSYNAYYGDMSRNMEIKSGCSNYDMESLVLTGNKISGPLPEWLGVLESLKYLDVSGNWFSGPIPAALGRLTALRELDLSINQLSGEIPPELGYLSSLRVLKVSSNYLNGTIPTSLGQLSSIETFDMSANGFTGLISEDHFAEVMKLKHLDISNNFLTFKVGLDWKPPFQLEIFAMDSCRIEGQFPEWIRTQKTVVRLELSNTSISGVLPKWLFNLRLTWLDLSNNYVQGPLPEFLSTLEHLDLSDNLIDGPLPHNIGNVMYGLQSLLVSGNRINGTIPDSLCNMKSLETLDLAKNSLSGELPECWRNFQLLRVLRLSSNRLSGLIPSSIGMASSLTGLFLNNNSFYGGIPSTLRNCTQMIVLDVGENNLSGELPIWIGQELLNLGVLRVHNNAFKGVIPSDLCQLYSLQVLDLGSNAFRGKIPRCFGNLSGMVKEEIIGEYASTYDQAWFEGSIFQGIKGLQWEYTRTLVYLINMDLSNNNLVGEIPEELVSLSGLRGLNLSHNNMTGNIPTRIGDLKSLESLDLSNNNLSGLIPQSLSALNFLGHLDLSNNNLSGQVPTGNQLQVLDANYAGNPQLCGAPLEKCSSEEPQGSSGGDGGKPEGGHESEEIWLYVVIGSGFATGFWGVIGVLVLKRSWRQAFFQLVDEVIEKVMVAIAIRVARLKT